MKETMLDDLCLILNPLLRPLGTPAECQHLLSFITGLSQSLRKELVTLCRGMSIPVCGTTLYAKTSNILSQIPTGKFGAFLLSLCTHPLYNGLVLSLCISMPLPDHAIRETYRKLLAKEMLVMETSPVPPQINYNCFFGDYTTPIHPSVQPNPKQAAAIHELIDRWIMLLEEKPFILPHITNKLVAKPTQELVRARYPEYVTFEEEGATQADLEYLYMTEGDLLEGGPCEIKQRWYTSGLTPRTYYAAGSDAYHKSKYVRNALNSLCDILPPTERFSRVNPHRVLLKSSDSHAIIYDLTSFTSNMHEQRYFLERLSMYCRGRRVRVLDACEGVVEVDLGDLLSSYNAMNIEPKYSSRKLLKSDLELAHHTAGFLGVYGNLASCTFLHGAIMSQIVDTFAQLGIAGDDGIVDSEDDSTTFFVIRLLGLMEESKVYNTEDDGWQVYLKRPIKQFLNRVYSESFALYSMLEHLFEHDDLRFFSQHRSRKERKGSLASSLVAYLRSLTRLILSSDEKNTVYAFLLGIYHHAGFPVDGYLPQLSTCRTENDQIIPQTLIPTLREDFIGKDPMEITALSLYDGVAVLTETSDERIDLDYDLCYAGCEFEATGNGVLSYLRKLGFVDYEQEEVVMSGEEGLKALLKQLMSQTSYTKYRVKVLRDIPVYLLP
nr:MAG: RdRp [Downy mildew lesion associated ambivirus 6]